VVDSLKVLDPRRPIREADLLIATAPWVSSAAKPIFVIPITALEQPQH